MIFFLHFVHVTHFLIDRDASLRSSVERIFTVWRERSVFEDEFIDQLLTTLCKLFLNNDLGLKQHGIFYLFFFTVFKFIIFYYYRRVI